ncbi:hypothetical protein [Bacillus pumilus]|nr:hypothetical protein [Bacillus pumilus]MED4440645.1 hypothetical protein [Bacillus pumilus]MED4489207.1 hypothetical protein [Bacillus pumilus]
MKKWFLQVFLTALITMWIQTGLDQANIIHSPMYGSMSAAGS